MPIWEESVRTILPWEKNSNGIFSREKNPFWRNLCYGQTLPDEANGRLTDRHFGYPVASVRIRSSSVRRPFCPFHVRSYPVVSVLSGGKFCACSKFSTDDERTDWSGRRPFCPLRVRSLSVPSVTHPLLIRYMHGRHPFAFGEASSERTTNGRLTDE